MFAVSVKVLQAYMRICRRHGLAPTVPQLLEFNRRIKVHRKGGVRYDFYGAAVQ